jgi:hypothetical protein
MQITEEEARKKWCPMVTYHGSPAHGGGVSRPGEHDHCYCIASKCMAWRWNWNQGGIKYGAGQKPTKGFCGLSGRTE